MSSSVGLLSLIFGNVLCSIGVIFANKYLFATLNFHYSATLTGLHFLCTTIFSHALVAGGVERAGELDRRRVLVLAFLTSYAVWSQNVSLLVNTVSIYQIAKLFVIPTTVALQFAMYRQGISVKLQIALFVVTAGVGLTTVSAVEGSGFGLLVALNGAVSTALQQLLYNVMMNDRRLSGIQLYYHIGPLCTSLMLVGGFFMDSRIAGDGVWITQATIPAYTWMWVALSCCMAFPMNYSSAMLLAKTSAVTFQVLGHVKTVLVFALGVLFFDSSMNAQQFAGIAVAMLGVVAYTHLKSRDAAVPTPLPVVAPKTPQ